ncbi:Metallo-dependent phosphatase-like protein [Aspergillus egyptiacus]|nr:Metallo-dependent phosphatase-like protein [Aspergillus egyptiacus]
MAFGKKSGLDALLQRPEQEGFWTRFSKSPIKFIAQFLYSKLFRTEHRPSNSISARVVCISDTHNTQPRLPEGDILIHAGDLTQSGTRKELEEQIAWLDEQPHRHKIVIAGNHELCLDHQRSAPSSSQSTLSGKDSAGIQIRHQTDPVDWKSLVYLQNSSTTVELSENRRLKVFGSPYTPKHGNWAFQYPRADKRIWEEVGIPDDADILITHGPPRSHLDLGHLGCWSLLSRLWGMQRKPVLHVFGHIHGAYGKETLFWDAFQEAYECIMNDKCKFWKMVKLGYFGLARLVGAGTRAGEGKTVMINAAAVGGVRDEKRREAICVDI